jgi:hypothetical protein
VTEDLSLRKLGQTISDLLEEFADVSEDAWNEEKLARLRANVIMLGLSTRAISTLPSITSKEQGRAAGGLRRLCLLLAVDRLSSTKRFAFRYNELPAAAAKLLIRRSHSFVIHFCKSNVGPK